MRVAGMLMMKQATPAVIATVMFVLLVGCSDKAPPEPTPPTDPLKQMEIAFEGQPSPREITPLLDEAMSATGLPVTSDNYSRAGSTLVALRQQNGTREMDILTCMPSRADDPRSDGTFAEVAAVCSVDISLGAYRVKGS